MSRKTGVRTDQKAGNASRRNAEDGAPFVPGSGLLFPGFRLGSGKDGIRWRRLPSRLAAGRARPLNFDARDPAAIHFDDRETKAAVFETFTATRDEAELVHHKASDGRVGGVFGEGDVVLSVEVADAECRIEHDGAVSEGQGFFDDVELVVNLTDKLLEKIFRGNETENAAELVDDHGDAHTASAQFAEQFARRLGFGNDQNLAQDAAEIKRRRRR